MRRLADLTKDLEKLGEETVRAQLMRGDYGLPGTGNATYEHVREWLSSKESERSEARAAGSAESRFPETLRLFRMPRS